MEYLILSEESYDLKSATSALEARVQDALGEGWKPLGGVAHSAAHGSASAHYTVVQAMTKGL